MVDGFFGADGDFGCCAAGQCSRTAVAPPAWHHAQHANDQAQGKCTQDHQNQRAGPLLAKEKAHGGIVLVV